MEFTAPISWNAPASYESFAARFLCVEHVNGDMSFINPDGGVGRIYRAWFDAVNSILSIAYLLEGESQYHEVRGAHAVAMAAHFKVLSVVMMTDEKRAAFFADLERSLRENPPTTASVVTAPEAPSALYGDAESTPSLLGCTPSRVDYRLAIDMLVEAHDASSGGPGVTVGQEWLSAVVGRISNLRALREADKP